MNTKSQCNLDDLFPLYNFYREIESESKFIFSAQSTFPYFILTEPLTRIGTATRLMYGYIWSCASSRYVISKGEDMERCIIIFFL